jgi:hypothetical protein
MDSLNEAAKPLIVSGKNIHFHVDKIEYGNNRSCAIDITHHFIKEENKTKPLCKFSINQNINLNSLEGDPSPGQRKKVFITYCINNHYQLVKEYNEDYNSLEKSIDINFDQLHYSFQFGWMNSDNPIHDFESILHKIRFHPAFYRPHPLLMHGDIVPSDSSRTHVMHLRIESDAIIHWSAKNKMNEEAFKKSLCEKYIDILKIHILHPNNRRPGDRLFVLSYSESNPVLDFLNEQNYPYFFINKDRYRGREWNAAIDLVTASNLCNGVFIGNFNIDRLDGSTFSYMLYTLLKKKQENILSVMIDLDHIDETPIVIEL